MAASPLEDHREIRIAGSDVDDLSDTINATRLKRDMLNASGPECIDYLSSLLSAGNARSHAESFDRQALLAHLLPERKLKSELTRVDIERIQSDADTGRNLGRNFRDFGS
jgi:hypothetical protein